MYSHSSRHFFPSHRREPASQVVRALPLALSIGAALWALLLTLLVLALHFG